MLSALLLSFDSPFGFRCSHRQTQISTLIRSWFTRLALLLQICSLYLEALKDLCVLSDAKRYVHMQAILMS